MCTWTIFLRSSGAPHSDKFNQQDININKLHNKRGGLSREARETSDAKRPKTSLFDKLMFFFFLMNYNKLMFSHDEYANISTLNLEWLSLMVRVWEKWNLHMHKLGHAYVGQHRSESEQKWSPQEEQCFLFNILSNIHGRNRRQNIHVIL